MIDTSHRSSPLAQVDPNTSVMDVKELFQMEDEVSQAKTDKLAQSDQISACQIYAKPILSPDQLDELYKAQAAHALTQQFQQQCTNTQLIENYTRAYKFHMKEASKFKALLQQLSGSIITDLDREDIELSYCVTEEMKKLIAKQSNAL